MARKLTAKQEAFAAAVAQGKSYAEAYRTSFDASRMKATAIQKESNKLKNNPLVAGRIAELSAPAVEKVKEVVEVDLPKLLFENARLGLSDIRRALTPEGAVRDPSEWDDDTAHAISGYETTVTQFFDKDGNVTGEKVIRKIKLWDKGTALDRLGRHFGMYEKDNAQRAANLFAGLPRETVKQIIEALARGRRPLLG